MGLFTSERARRDGRVTFVQLVTSVAAFLLFSVMGGVLLAGLALPAVTVAGQATNGTSKLFEALPQVFDQTTLPQASSIYASDGTTLLATFYDENRVVVPLEDISPWIQIAQVDVEDKRFWEHHGVDGDGLVRAGYQYLVHNGQEGASTITQQLVKNTLLAAAQNITDPTQQQAAIKVATDFSISRKIREWSYALAYEDKVNKEYGTNCTADPKVDCGKEFILQQYLNIAQYGPSVYGVETASELYFGKHAKDLNAIEAATIAGITQNPTQWDPIKHPDQAKIRRDHVLLTMHDHINPQTGERDLSSSDYFAAINTPVEATLNVTYPKASCAASTLAPFFCDYVTRIIAGDPAYKGEGQALLLKGGLKIVTTLDAAKQADANAAVTAGVPPSDPSQLEDALVSLDNATGNVLAMAQNRPFDPTGKTPGSAAINYSVDHIFGGSNGFSPGSSFKPIVLAEWLDSGHGLNQVVTGQKTKFDMTKWKASCLPPNSLTGIWPVSNSEPSEARQMSVLKATTLSVNTAYASISSELDLCSVRDMASKLGFERADGADIQLVPSITLGSQNASPLDMASVYQTFANGGVHCEPRVIESIATLDGSPVTFKDGTEVVPPPTKCSQVIRQEVATAISYALQTVLKPGGTAPTAGIGRPAAGKTGTSEENKHMWFVGYTPQITTAVWVGNAEYDVPMQGSRVNGRYQYFVINGVAKSAWYGGTIAAPIWQAYMVPATAGMDPLGFPAISSQMLTGVKTLVPDVRNLAEKAAQDAINNAGFSYALSGELIYDPSVPAGTIVKQSPDAGSMALPGSTVTYYMSSASYPAWWYNWPSGWDQTVPPSDWWGGAGNWPPVQFKTNPPTGWVTKTAPVPTPTPSPPPNKKK
ncbi:penicillin-binding protein [Demequina lutea]|uniref:Membrane peptidoglycan carboxypeptidase n=1 Tax=Demequina lutea TaxID=431489 RepID=A0A7Y9ZEK0_9MICO|nr:penicillin-binding protein [Demequina lutea]NYI42535.1 membrane peptidoglycan carboxypeptidase [Demequina lutea]